MSVTGPEDHTLQSAGVMRPVKSLAHCVSRDGNKQASLESQQKLETGRKALCASTGLLESDCEFLETLYKKNAGISASVNLYGEYGYDPKVSRWTPDGFATYMEVHPEIAKAMFKMMDDDGDGTLDFDEFAKGYGFITKGSASMRLNLLFKIFDLDNSDTLDKVSNSTITSLHYLLLPQKSPQAEVRVMVRTIITAFNDAAVSSTGPGGSSIAAQAKLMKAKKAAEKIDPVKLEKQFAKEVERTTTAIFKVCDSNKDGDIDRKEFLQALEPKSSKDPTPKCPEIVKVLNLFEGGSIKQWNCLGKFIEVNGAKPKEDDYDRNNDDAANAITTPQQERKRTDTMSPGCSQQ
ncbi:hypothetical protein TL16_g05945 [Triparma laevis f. inornata]|uniref:EF-hand domain-containing protein n=1 Tax=Triparma laevis f. inornata TaxID=1714386 RepID=A0A9W7AQH6_9STRA|nr:hypothetical protein TL16_g05945 [Triparma laevis f. inornata]